MEVINMSEENKKEVSGRLTYVAKTGGIHLDGSSDWLNPADEVKPTILAAMNDIKKFMGKKVKVRFDDKGFYRSIEALEEAEKKEEPQQETKKESEVRITETSSKGYSSPKDGHIEMTGTFTFEPRQSWDKEYFGKLNKVQCETKKKGELTYISWANAWEALKKLHPDAQFKVHENSNGMPYFYDKTGAFTKVSVSVCGLTHTVHLPVMDYKNKSIPTEQITTFDINKSIQRTLSKAIGMHGLGLHCYRGEDLAEEPK
jgi:hypothetical protein